MIGTTPSQLGGLQVTWCDTVRSSNGTRMFLKSIWVLLTLRRSTASQLSLHVATSVFTPRDSARGSLLPPRARDHRRGDLIASPFGLHARLRWTRLCLRRAGRGRRRARACIVSHPPSIHECRDPPGAIVHHVRSARRRSRRWTARVHRREASSRVGGTRTRVCRTPGRGNNARGPLVYHSYGLRGIAQTRCLPPGPTL